MVVGGGIKVLPIYYVTPLSLLRNKYYNSPTQVVPPCSGNTTLVSHRFCPERVKTPSGRTEEDLSSKVIVRRGEGGRGNVVPPIFCRFRYMDYA
jgi:hypothetical protein